MMAPFFLRATPFAAIPRTLRVSDAMECSRLHQMSFAHPWSIMDFEALLNDPACVGDGVDDKSGLLGFILSRRAADEAEVLTIVVAAAARRHGYGLKLLTSHIARLAAFGVRNLFLEVDEANAPALKLYRRFSFSVEGTRKGYYAKNQGKRSDALIMRRSLN
ncbi:GNAT family N-acetyltransferase [Rhodoblastus acidophilus]|uniref:GNAT family N-acetyltransferase n=1 Tax=Candidatus Rhodoblastus alkanivorans TaxID=2954117 RepID=A0ABS9Z1B7_9HYPH|nr:GNAT family N-acetyltransferase [Candidatus Rhodoblastus alkanivorans]MCI4679446.1 GNAT family N-acetyltransferase [Candidatus Rhodoblastus alkanivorans]MCI4681454.1 GNAT family N-acetyltransferase [Candidatus Rhodoblastus alkanivorans]MDI4642502.1 GNAT family N-acetyltransferase [Rhodoblastus acidophilus]